MQGISIYPNKELRKELDEICKEEQRSFNNLVLFILKKYVESKRK